MLWVNIRLQVVKHQTLLWVLNQPQVGNISTVDEGVNLVYVFTWSDGATGNAPTGYTFNLGTTSAVEPFQLHLDLF